MSLWLDRRLLNLLKDLYASRQGVDHNNTSAVSRMLSAYIQSRGYLNTLNVPIAPHTWSLDDASISAELTTPVPKNALAFEEIHLPKVNPSAI
jgi:hypothetical protein